ncbi:uncharacterized protein SPPG_09101 [Spizellomyces punctatus DAOM BR117]|uniref:AAA+ ATPase domain-containing protein n=1 Tax=Spizellomyces punctatus (strain DAOM BR117) TaxID=645134 RepID=A0A0L0HKS5_SPIPD|nr:uncharacterized protein SPPG_09101 [Spizellomyces punctatus DAOM BR117]KND01439.1 hypothetical protein SPPG_09101 [Spizellomyces punctatus DAOM BR117]|eukprot:XP_016609478.1 hypothetical protein SPPG_09101 [Spizellomyces punctatus DAOM BR117]
MNQQARERLHRFQTHLFAAEACLDAAKGQKPQGATGQQTHNPLDAAGHMRKAMLQVDAEAADAAENIYSARLTGKDLLLAIKRRHNIAYAEEEYLQMYGKCMEPHFDSKRAGSVAAQVEKILVQRRGRLESRMQTWKSELTLDGMMDMMCIDDSMDLAPPDLTEFGVAKALFANVKQSTPISRPVQGQGISMQHHTPAPAPVSTRKSTSNAELLNGAVNRSQRSESSQMRKDLFGTESVVPQSGSSLHRRFSEHVTGTQNQNVRSSTRGPSAGGHVVSLAALRPSNRRTDTSDDLDPMDMDERSGYKRRARDSDEEESEEDAFNRRSNPSSDGFMTGGEKLALDNLTKNRGRIPPSSGRGGATLTKRKKHLGTNGRRFVSPLLNRDEENSTSSTRARKYLPQSAQSQEGEEVDERLRNIEPRMIETIMNEMLDKVAQVTWNDIAGLELAKSTIKEIVVFPMLRPDIFCGVRAPSKGLLLFGPPGTGKTLIGKCIASQCKATFFSISSSSLTSKWIGDGEKMVRALFAVARVHQPSVIFVDEIDSLLTQRTDGEHDATRRIKTEFLVQFDGCGTDNEDRILLIGATNRPHEIDEAARRRFRKRLYIPLPEAEARRSIVLNLLSRLRHALSDEHVDEVIRRTDGYSGSDMDGLVREAALDVSDVRPIILEDFIDALTQVKPSVSPKDLELYVKFDQEFGSVSRKP